MFKVFLTEIFEIIIKALYLRSILMNLYDILAPYLNSLLSQSLIHYVCNWYHLLFRGSMYSYVECSMCCVENLVKPSLQMEVITAAVLVVKLILFRQSIAPH